MPKQKFLRLFLIAGLFILPLNISASGATTGSAINSPPATTSGWDFTGEQSLNYLGQSWMPVGDVNGDRFDDLIIGAYGYNTNSGRAYLFYGSATGLHRQTPDWIVNGEMTESYWLQRSWGRDVNGDGFDDVLVGSHGYDLIEPAAANVGRVYLYLGSGDGLAITPAWTFTGSQAVQAVGVELPVWAMSTMTALTILPLDPAVGMGVKLMKDWFMCFTAQKTDLPTQRIGLPSQTRLPAILGRP
jgi:hypothetical protein